MLNRSIQFYVASVRQPYVYHTNILLYHCTAEVREYKCHENFWGSKSKHYHVHALSVSVTHCLRTVKTRISPFGPLITVSNWTTNNHDRYSCSWFKTKVNHFIHFTVHIYPGVLVGNDDFIHQTITRTICIYKTFSCSPSEVPKSCIVWRPSSHSFQRYRSLGLFQIQQLSDFMLIPQLKFRGAIQKQQAKGLLSQLGNGFLIIKQRTTSNVFQSFLQNATHYLSKARPPLQTGILEAHITLILENQRHNMTSLWEQFCYEENRLLQITKWMIRHFQHSSANWAVQSPGHKVEIIGDSILLSKCFSITNYIVYWNRSISTCFRELQVKIFTNKNCYVSSVFKSQTYCSWNTN